jgi:hypothetical protein
MNEDDSSNDSLMCIIANEAEIKHNKSNTSQYFQKETKDKEAEKNNIKQLNRIIIKDLDLKSLKISPSSSKKSHPMNLKRLREIDLSSSDDELNSKNKVTSVKNKIKLPKLSSSSSDEEVMVKPVQKLGYSKFSSNKSSIKPPSTDNKTKLLSDKNSKSLYDNQKTITGEVLSNKRAIQVIEAPKNLKKTKIQETTIITPLHEKNEKKEIELRIRDEKEASSESEENEAPKLNTIDMHKKIALDKVQIKKFTNQPAVKITNNKAIPLLKKLNFKEKNSILNKLSKKETKYTSELSLTQQINISKQENIARLKLAQQEKNNETNNEVIELDNEQINVQSSKPSTSYKFNNSVNSKSITDSRSFKPSTSNKQVIKLNEKPKIETEKLTNKQAKNNDIIGLIMNDMNKNNLVTSNKKAEEKNENLYKIENFIFRILNWNFVWLIEQG